MRTKAAVDANQAALIQAFRDLGCSVQPLHMVGRGCPDALVGFRGVDRTVEFKDGSKPPSKQKLRDSQIEWHRDWQGHPVHIVRSVDDVLKFVREWA